MKKVIISSSSSQNKNGFSLVEAMIMLVVVSVIMAVMAPLMVNKAKANQGRVIYPDGASVRTAQGNNQELIIGSNGNNNNDKLEVNGKAKVTQGLYIGNQKDNNNNYSYINNSYIKNDSIRVGDDSKTIFEVTTDNTTNIEASVPNYSLKTQINAGGSCVAPSNGFFYINDSLKNYAITPNSNEAKCTAPTTNNTQLQLNVEANALPMLVPVQMNDKLECGTGATCYFMPLSNANTQ